MTSLLPRLQAIACKEPLIRKPFYVGMEVSSLDAAWCVPIPMNMANYFGVGVKEGAISFNLAGVSNNAQLLPGGIAGIIIDNSRFATPLIPPGSTFTALIIFPDNNNSIPTNNGTINIQPVFTSVPQFTMYLQCDIANDLRNFSLSVTPLNFRPEPYVMSF